MACPYRAHILAQIRVGRRSWSLADVADDRNVFRTQIIEPLRQLKYEGVLAALSEIESERGNDITITGVTIIGAVGEPRPVRAG